MSTPRIAVSQGPYHRDVEEAVSRALSHMRQAASRGVDLIVFPEWFMGLNPVEVIPNRHTNRISRLARELNMVVVTGSVRTLEQETGKKQQRSLVIERDGTIPGTQAKMIFHPTERPWFEPGNGLNAITTRWGRIVILPGLDALDPLLWADTLRLHPDLVVMASNPKNSTERAQLHEMAVIRSVEISGSVVLAPLVGRFSGTQYVGGALIAHQGRILSLTEEEETVLIAGDPEAPMIQLGVTDISCYVPISPAPKEMAVDPKRALGPEGERKVILDWGALRSSDTLAAGREILSLAQENPRWAGLAPARPHESKALASLLERGAAGAFTYPGLDRVFPWNETLRDIGKTLAPYRRPLLVHSGPGPAPVRYDAPSLWDDFLLEFPVIPVILLHMGSRSPFIEEALLIAERHPQVWLETSWAPIGAIREAIAAIGAERMVFGSGGLARDFTREWDKLQILEQEIPPDLFQKIVNMNARALFFHDSHPELMSRGDKIKSIQ